MPDSPVLQDIYNYVVQNEGKRSAIYEDTRKNPTVGVGLNLNDPVTASLVPLEVRRGKRAMTPQEVDATARKRFDLAVNDARSYVGADTFDLLSPMQQKAIVDMSYNMGLPKLRGFKNMRLAVLGHNDQEAKNQLLDSDYARAKDTRSRALRNAELIRQGTYIRGQGK